MRTAFISDVHSNLEALLAVEQKLRDLVTPVDEIICVGDVVGYGADPIAVTKRVKDLCSVTLLGNHDEAIGNDDELHHMNPIARDALLYTRRQLMIHPFLRSFLTDLPTSHHTSGYHAVHADYPDDVHSYILSALSAFPALERMPEKIPCFFGHVHIPVAYIDSVKSSVAVNQPTFELNFTAPSSFTLEIPSTGKALINIGSVGQPRDHDPRACFVVYDDLPHTVTWYRVPYDLRETQRKIREARLPEQLAHRLEIGR